MKLSGAGLRFLKKNMHNTGVMVVASSNAPINAKA